MPLSLLKAEGAVGQQRRVARTGTLNRAPYTVRPPPFYAFYTYQVEAFLQIVGCCSLALSYPR